MRFGLSRQRGAAFTACVALGLSSQAANALDMNQKQEVRTIVREYLLEHPEVLLEAMNALETKRTAEEASARRATIEASRAALTTTPEGTVLGAADGDVTLIEFFDYNCGYCKRAASDMETLLDSDPKLRVVLKEIPVLGPASEAASRVSLAFRSLKPADYPAFQRKLLASRTQVDEARALSVAAEFAVDPPALKAATEQSVLFPERS